ncbi:hypothetical protein LCGC14_2141100, partial [marine sediment metagenome]
TDAVRGFTQIAVCSGKPTGIPADIPGQIPMIIDGLTGDVYVYALDKWISMSDANIVGPLTAFGEVLTGQLHPVFQGSFEYTVDNTRVTTNAGTNGGTVTQANAMAVLGTSITTASVAMLTSRVRAKYRSGLGGLMKFTALFTSPVADTDQYIGMADEVGSSEAFENGFMIGYDGLTFGVHRFQNDVKVTIAQVDFDDPLDGTGPSGVLLDQTKINVYSIQFQYLGAGAINFFIENSETGKLVQFHTLKYANLNVVPSVFNPNFQFCILVDNKATISDMIIKSSSYAYFIEGKTDRIQVQQPQFSSGEQTAAGVSGETALLTIRVKASYAGKNNFLEAIMLFASVSVEASSVNNLGNARLVLNTTLGGVPSYSDINTSDSIMELDVAGTTVTGGTELFSGVLAGKNDGVGTNLTDFEFLLEPGDTLTLAVSSVNSATFKGSLLWKELF